MPRYSHCAGVGVALLGALLSPASMAKPIAFAGGTTAMVEYGAGTMEEAQVFFAPTHRYSVGAGYLKLDSDVDGSERNIAYARANLLAKRWNLEAAQANVFAWGGAGGASGSDFSGGAFTGNAGAQADYETRRVYASLKTDLYDSSEFTHRIDTLQLGIAPYAHEYEELAVWLLVQGRTYTGNLYRGTEWAALLRVFKGSVWIEAGVTEDGNLQSMVMVNF
ncbi:MAG: hypothetical protein JNK40_08850 [Chromatiales bacterium]|nr:hypothetical protein [Chromatiales bacterium]